MSTLDNCSKELLEIKPRLDSFFERLLQEYSFKIDSATILERLKIVFVERNLKLLFGSTSNDAVFLRSIENSIAANRLIEEYINYHLYLPLIEKMFNEISEAQTLIDKIVEETKELQLLNPIVNKGMTTVNYNFHRIWGKPGNQDNRPYTEVEIIGNTGSSLRVFCLVDSGADIMMLPDSFATGIGINLSTQGIPHSTKTASGATLQLKRIQNLNFKIEGNLTTGDCLFSPSCIPIIGRNSMLLTMDFGFDLKGWMG